MSKVKEKEAAECILAYLEEQNRPYSAVDIFNNLHKEHGKTVVVRGLEQLATDGKIKEKIYGKQKVYVANQSKYDAVADEELKTMDEEINSLTKTVESDQKTVKSLETTCNRLSSSVTTDDARTQLANFTSEIEILEVKLADLASDKNKIAPEEKIKICNDFENNVKQWRKRKRIAVNILDSICEGYPKPKKTLYEDIGIDTDEENSAVMPSI